MCRGCRLCHWYGTSVPPLALSLRLINTHTRNPTALLYPSRTRTAISARALQTICLSPRPALLFWRYLVVGYHMPASLWPLSLVLSPLRRVDGHTAVLAGFVPLAVSSASANRQGVWERCLLRMLVLAALTTSIAKGCANRDRRIRVSLQNTGLHSLVYPPEWISI